MSTFSSVPGGDITMSDLATPSVPSLTSSSSASTSGNPNDVPIDVEAIAARYKLYGRIKRLLYIGNHSVTDRKRALQLITDTVKKDTLDINLYRTLYAKEETQTLLNSNDQYRYSSEWVDTAEKIIQSRQNSIEKDISLHTNSQIRENIRRAYIDLASFETERGYLGEALRTYLRAREYCANSREVTENTLAALELAVLGSEWTTIPSIINRQDVQNEIKVNVYDNFQSKIHSILGLYALHEKKYDDAVHHFRTVSASMGDSFATLIHIEDIAIYLALCALATMDRRALKQDILGSSSVKAILEYQSSYREIIQDIINSKYTQALQALERNKPELLLDSYIGPHIEALFHRIRCKVISQYLYPYTVVNLSTMSNTLQIDPLILQELIVELIRNQTVSGRIDARSQTFRQHVMEPRKAAIEKVFVVGQQFINEAQGLILKETLKKHKLVIKKPSTVTTTSSTGSATVDANKGRGGTTEPVTTVMNDPSSVSSLGMDDDEEEHMMYHTEDNIPMFTGGRDEENDIMTAFNLSMAGSSGGSYRNIVDTVTSGSSSSGSSTLLDSEALRAYDGILYGSTEGGGNDDYSDMEVTSLTSSSSSTKG